MKSGTRRRIALVSVIVWFSAFAQAETCPVTIPEIGAIDSAPTHRGKDQWYGSEALTALIPMDGIWQADPAKKYRRKLWWWRDGFDAKQENFPQLDVSAVKLNAAQTTVPASRGASSKDDDWNVMFVLMRFPEPGCWKVTGKYQGRALSFVLMVGE